MGATEGWLIAVAVGFAVVNGYNDGGALLAVGLSVRSVRPLTGLLVLAGAVVVAPVLLGTAVATTLTSRLVTFDGRDGQLALLVAVTAAVAVTALLARRGLPTSLTLAVVGALTGAGLGAGLPVSWGTVVVVLLLAGVAPLAGLGLAWLLTVGAARVSLRSPLDTVTRRWHAGAFALQSLAYGANDGQKMLAVLAIAVGTAGSREVPAVAWQLATVGAAFLVGAAVGLPRIASTLGGGVVPVRPPDAVVTELSAAAVVLGTGAVGSPVSMTQAISGAQVGTGVTRGLGRIRWREVARIGGAWIITLPVAGASAALATAALLAIT